MTDKELIEIAEKAREKAYAPYSSYRVGAALLCSDGTVFCGCNIENASFSPTVCAERTAIFHAVSEGRGRKRDDFEAIAVIGGKDEPSFASPCGVCRQVMSEFCSPDFRIILSKDGKIVTYKLSELLPQSFSL